MAERVKPGEKKAGKAAQAAERRLTIVEMRKRGHAPERIASKLDIDVALVETEIVAGLASYFPRERAATTALLLSQLDDLYRMNHANAVRNVSGIIAGVRIIEVKAKISGAYAPERHEHSGPDGKPIAIKDVSKMSETELRDYLIANGIDPGPEPPNRAG